MCVFVFAKITLTINPLPTPRPSGACVSAIPFLYSNLGKFTFIDLAGSERGADTKDSDKQTRFLQWLPYVIVELLCGLYIACLCLCECGYATFPFPGCKGGHTCKHRHKPHSLKHILLPPSLCQSLEF